MKLRSTSIAFAFLLLACATAVAAELRTSAPEAQGVPSQSVQTFIETLEKEVDAPHGIVIVRHGHVIAQGWWSPYQRDGTHMLYSLSKSFTSTAIGMLADEGKIDIDAPVLSFFPDDGPKEPSANLKAMRVRDLLSMNTGHHNDTLAALTQGGDDNWPRRFLSLEVEHHPGTHFRYNTGATYMCSAILQKITGKTVLEYLTPRLFKPLGIEKPTWENDPKGVNVGGWGLKVTTQDIARFGQLYLQRGEWEGKRLLSANWVALASAAQTDNGTNPDSDWNQGYGFQFWRCRHNGFRGDGAFGQFCIVMPDQNAVIAITAGQGDMQKTLNLIWEHLLPAMKDGALPANKSAADALAKKLASLNHPTVKGDAKSALAAKVSGKVFTLEDNAAKLKSVALAIDGAKTTLVLTTEQGEQRFAIGFDAWATSDVMFHKLGIPIAATTAMQPVAASGAWTSGDTFTIRAWLTETPFRLDVSLKFSDDGRSVTLSTRMHPMQGKAMEIKGTAK